MNTKIKLIDVWKQNQHLNFGEICQVVRTGEDALNEAVIKITRRKVNHGNQATAVKNTYCDLGIETQRVEQKYDPNEIL